MRAHILPGRRATHCTTVWFALVPATCAHAGFTPVWNCLPRGCCHSGATAATFYVPAVAFCPSLRFTYTPTRLHCGSTPAVLALERAAAGIRNATTPASLRDRMLVLVHVLTLVVKLPACVTLPYY